MTQADVLEALRYLREHYRDESKRTPGWDAVVRARAIKLWLVHRGGTDALMDATISFLDLVIKDVESSK